MTHPAVGSMSLFAVMCRSESGELPVHEHAAPLYD